MKKLILLPGLILLVSLSARSQESTTVAYPDTHLGMFVHYMHPAKEYLYGYTQYADGSKVQSLDELADNLDIQDLADMASLMRAEYVIFTAWHANMNALYPSKVMKKKFPGHFSKRDVIGELADALKEKNIPLVLYIHPSDGHDFSPEDQQLTGWSDPAPYTRWNDFINEVMEELTDRYAERIAGYYIDGGIPPQVNADRLRNTILTRKPDAWLIQNSGLRPDLVNYGAIERMEKPWPASTWMMCHTIAAEWWAMEGTVNFCPELAFQYTVLQAAVSGRTGGGVAWSFGPHPQGRWELGVRQFCTRLGELIEWSGNSILGTVPSKSFPTPDKTPLAGLAYAATELPDGSRTYLHVFKPQRSDVLVLPFAADGRKFSSARILDGKNRIPVRLKKTDAGYLLRVDSPKAWDDIDTIIELK